MSFSLDEEHREKFCDDESRSGEHGRSWIFIRPSVHLSIRRWAFRGRRSHARNVYVPRKSARSGREGFGGGGCARDEVEDGIGIANIPLLRLSRSPWSISLLLHRPLTRPPARSACALTPDRARGAYRGAYFQESSPADDKSPDFAGPLFLSAAAMPKPKLGLNLFWSTLRALLFCHYFKMLFKRKKYKAVRCTAGSLRDAWAYSLFSTF